MTPTRILLATDFSEPAERACELTKTFRESFGATVHVVHVIFSDDDKPLVERSLRDKHLAAYRLGLETMLESLGKGFGPGPEVTTELLQGRPKQLILAAAHATKADLICVGTTGRSMLDRLLMGSVAQSLIRNSDMPVLTTP